MRRGFWLLALTLVSLSTTGCGQSQDAAPAQADAAAGQGAQAAPAAPVDPALAAATATPEQAVSVFLNAVRDANDAQAEQLLTQVAREKARALDMGVQIEAGPTLKYALGEVEYVGEDKTGAQVACQWTEVIEGEPSTQDIIWVLRKENGGWRIAGLITMIFPDAPPLVLDYENPEEVIRNKELAQAEIMRRAALEEQAAAAGPANATAQQPAFQAQQPSGPNQLPPQ